MKSDIEEVTEVGNYVVSKWNKYNSMMKRQNENTDVIKSYICIKCGREKEYHLNDFG